MTVLNVWNGGVVIISHDERFITNVAKEVNFCFSWTGCKRGYADLDGGIA